MNEKLIQSSFAFTAMIGLIAVFLTALLWIVNQAEFVLFNLEDLTEFLGPVTDNQASERQPYWTGKVSSVPSQLAREIRLRTETIILTTHMIIVPARHIALNQRFTENDMDVTNMSK